MPKKRQLDAAALARAAAEDGPPFDVFETAAVLRLSPTTIYELVRTGELRGIRPPGTDKVQVERAAIRDYQERARAAGVPA